jgi:transposase
VFARLHGVLLERLNAAGRIDWSASVVDGSHIRALQGALTGPSPVDRARTGSKHHLIVDRRGIPRAITLTGGNRNDVTQLLALIDGVGPVRGKPGRPRRRAEAVIADRGYDHDKYRRQLWGRGVQPIIARRGSAHGSGLGALRWVVERTFARLHCFGRLRVRWERLPRLARSLHEPGLRHRLLALPPRVVKPPGTVTVPVGPVQAVAATRRNSTSVIAIPGAAQLVTGGAASRACSSVSNSTIEKPRSSDGSSQ